MCRFVGYLGSKILLNDLVLRPNHSIYVQSWQPKELTYAKINADGFGFGWYTDDGIALSYRNHLPIWNDVNLHNLSLSLCSSSWIVMVRSATAQHPSSHFNVQPFKHGRYLFSHNGFIQNFNDGILQQLLSQLPSEITRDIQGLTDSEYLFALFRHLLTGDDVKAIQNALIGTVRWCEQHLSDRKAILNMLVADGNSLVAIRHSINEAPASLYFTDGDYRDFPPCSRVIASEKFSEDDCWQPTPESCLLTAMNDQPIHVQTL